MLYFEEIKLKRMWWLFRTDMTGDRTHVRFPAVCCLKNLSEIERLVSDFWSFWFEMIHVRTTA